MKLLSTHVLQVLMLFFHQLIFEATITWGVRGDIALDDIKLTLTECSQSKYCTDHYSR